MFKKNKIIKKINSYIEDCNQKNVYTLFDSKYSKEIFFNKLSTDKVEYFYNLIKGWDDALTVPKEVGKYLESLIDDENLIVGVHRTEIQEDLKNDIKMKNILEQGLKNYGDLSSGIVYNNADLSKTVSFPGNILNLMILLKSTYKFSNGGFILAFPSEITDNEGTITNDNAHLIYDKISGVNHIKPEYILGYIDSSYGVMNFFSREKLLQYYESSMDSNAKSK